MTWPDGWCRSIQTNAFRTGIAATVAIDIETKDSAPVDLLDEEEYSESEWWFSAADSHYEAKKSHFQSLIIEVTFDRFVNLLVRGIRIGYCQTLMGPPGAPRGWGPGVVVRIVGI